MPKPAINFDQTTCAEYAVKIDGSRIGTVRQGKMDEFVPGEDDIARGLFVEFTEVKKEGIGTDHQSTTRTHHTLRADTLDELRTKIADFLVEHTGVMAELGITTDSKPKRKKKA